MERHDAYYRQYVQILREELRPATGCTEPIAIAYAAAKARSVLGALPDRVLVEVSGNIIKNVKSVVVPHTGGLRGIPAAAAAGIVAGDAEAQLEVLSGMTEAQSAAISPFLKVVPFRGMIDRMCYYHHISFRRERQVRVISCGRTACGCTEDCPICTGSAAGIPQRSDSFHAE